MIDACGGRFLIIRDSEPKPAQRAALVAEIHKLVWLNDHRFYSVVTQGLETEKLELLQRLQEIENKLKEETTQNVNEENPVLPEIYDTLGGIVGIAGWIFFIVLNAVVIFTKGKHELCNVGAILCVVVIFMVTFRNNLSPDVAVPINMSLCSMFVVTATCNGLLNLTIVHKILMYIVVLLSFLISGLALGLILATATSIKTWSDVLIACHAAPGITLGAILSTIFCSSFDQKYAGITLTIALKSFLFCSVGAMLSMGLVTVFCWVSAVLGVKMTTILLIVGFTMGYFYLTMRMFLCAVSILILPCCCVLIGSIILVL